MSILEIQKTGVDCEVLEGVKKSTMRWYGHVRKMREGSVAERVYQICATDVSARFWRGN